MERETDGWIKIADSVETLNFESNHLLQITVDGHSVCLAQTDKGIVAFTNRCPHAGADLSDGRLDNRGNIVCCKHNYKFNLSNGRDALNEGYFLKMYALKETTEGLFINLSTRK